MASDPASQLLPGETAAQVVATGLQVWEAWSTYIDQRTALDTGTVNGGPNGNGTYPITLRSGSTVFVKCPAQTDFETRRAPVRVHSGADAYTLSTDDYGSINRYHPASAAVISITLDGGAPQGSAAIIRGVGAQVKLLVANGASIESWSGNNGTIAAGAALSARVEELDGNGHAIWTIEGATGSIA